MRFIHTADWHLGRLFHSVHLTDDQQHVLDQFVDLVADVRPAAVLVAGDIYDRGVPPPEAVELLNDVLERIVRGLGVPVVMIAGNHDSPTRLGFGSRLLAAEGLHIAGPPPARRRPLRAVRRRRRPTAGAGRAVRRPHRRARRSWPSPTPLSRLTSRPCAPWWRAPARPCRPARAPCSSATPSWPAPRSPTPNGRSPSAAPAPCRRRCSPASTTSPSVTCTARSGRRRGRTLRRFAAHLLFDEVDPAQVGEHRRDRRGGERRAAPAAVPPAEASSGAARRPRRPPPRRACHGRTGRAAPRRRVRVIEGTLRELLERAPADDSRDDYVCARLTDKGALLNAMAQLQQAYPNCLHLEFPGPGLPAAGPPRSPTGPPGPRASTSPTFFEQVTDDRLSAAESAVFGAVLDRLERRWRES